MDKLDNEYLVFTSHDTSTKFNDFSTYYIPDSILIIGDKKDPEYWKDENAQIIINALKTKMNAAGYTAANKDEADLGLQVSYVASTYISTVTIMTDPGGAIIPVIGIPATGRQLGRWMVLSYPITYSYSTGSLLADMINLKNAPEGQKEKLTVVWNAYISGLLGGSGSLNVNRTTTAINQAFTQSPYLKKIT